MIMKTDRSIRFGYWMLRLFYRKCLPVTYNRPRLFHWGHQLIVHCIIEGIAVDIYQVQLFLGNAEYQLVLHIHSCHGHPVHGDICGGAG